MERQNEFELLSKLIRKRRSVFPVQFSDEPIPQDFIDQMLELGNWAPTHRRTEPWRYVVLSGNAKKRLGEFLANKYESITPADSFNPSKKIKTLKKCLQSQYIVLICMQRDELARVPEWEEIAAVAMSVQNMWLACTARGIGSYWSSPKTIEYIDEFISLNIGERCLGLFYLGMPDGDLSTGQRESMADKIRYVTA